MPTELGQLLATERKKRNMSLRDVERETGLHNAHLSQIETGGIERPHPNVLWMLASLYGLDFRRLLRLAGHTEVDKGSRRKSLVGTALSVMGELSPAEQEEALQFMVGLRQKKKSAQGPGPRWKSTR